MIYVTGEEDEVIVLNAGIPAWDKRIKITLNSYDMEVLPIITREKRLQIFQILPYDGGTIANLHTDERQCTIEERDVLTGPGVLDDRTNLASSEFLGIDHGVHTKLLHKDVVFTLEVLWVVDASNGMTSSYSLSKHTCHDVGRFVGGNSYEEICTSDMSTLKVGEQGRTSLDR